MKFTRFLNRLILSVLLGSGSALYAQNTSPSQTPPLSRPPVVSAPLPEPATVSRVTFTTKNGTVKDRLILTLSPNHYRVDQPQAQLTVIYQRGTQVFIGLEQSNATWWTFSWPEIQGYIEKSQRYEARLRDLTSDGLVHYDSPSSQQDSASNSAPPSTASTDPATTDLPNVPHIVWNFTQQTKLIAGYPCTLWIGTYPTGEIINAWCTLGIKREILDPVRSLREINEPMALGPVRELAPPSIFPIYDTLTKGGNTPVLLSWGSKDNGSQFAIAKIETIANRPDFYTIPKYFTATTLITLDGIIPPQTSPATSIPR